MTQLHTHPARPGSLVVLSHAPGLRPEHGTASPPPCRTATPCCATTSAAMADARHCRRLRHGRPGNDDTAELIRAQGTGPVHFVGLSMGGMTAQALAARHPGLVRSIVVVTRPPATTRPRARWQACIDTVTGQRRTADRRRRAAALVHARVPRRLAITAALPASPGCARCSKPHRRALRRGLRGGGRHRADEGNARIVALTLVIAGSRDEATRPRCRRPSPTASRAPGWPA